MKAEDFMNLFLAWLKRDQYLTIRNHNVVIVNPATVGRFIASDRVAILIVQSWLEFDHVGQKHLQELAGGKALKAIDGMLTRFSAGALVALNAEGIKCAFK